MKRELLVVAGEASGDRMVAAAVRELAPRGVRAFGVGGDASRRAGVEILAPTSALASMGALDVVKRAPAIVRALLAVIRRTRASRPRAALLANFTELSARLGPWLRRSGVRVVWCAAPQVWAWRPGRAASLARAMDRLAVVLPFEVPIWRAVGVDATYVGHPALDLTRGGRDGARRALGLDASARAVAVLAGSRAGEVERLAAPLCAAAALLRARGVVDAIRVLRAPDLPASARARLDATARSNGLEVVDVDPEAGAAPLLPAFDAALVASGTASLEAALAGASPVVAYRMDAIAFAVAKRLVTTPFVALPNVVLGRRVVPELLQDDATAPRIAEAAERALTAGTGAAIADELRAKLQPEGPPATFGSRLASLFGEWPEAP